ncbi:VIT1/CCC1 transporter family protein [Silvibacterium sp.]|uniref:VIT1/CCC1 transporter family protein n=1 Tax=Silvibacterium sp. TaxID=1964179 RepID=UPI0039E5B025
MYDSHDPRLRKLLAALEANWQAEMTGHYTYLALAREDSDPIRKRTLEHMAESEAEHAEAWAGRIAELGGEPPRYKGKPNGDADSLANRLGGKRMALRRLEIDESRAIAHYGQQLKELNDEPSLAILRRVIDEEREHYIELGTLIREHYPRRQAAAPVNPQALLEELLAKRSGSGRQAAGWIGDAIYGVNDGLGAIFGIVSGVSGATVGNSHYVLLAGIAGMIASALSMGSGAYLAAKSEREIYEAEVERERESIEMNAPESRELLSLYYQVKGLPEDDADRVVDHIARDKKQFLRALSAERLNATEDALPNPITSAVSGAISTAVGAFVPIIPFFFLRGYEAILVSAVVSLLAHFAVGAAKSLITVRSWWSSGLEMTLVGALEGVVTYVIGIGLGHVGA